MPKFSIAGNLPVNVIIEAESEQEALALAEINTLVEYEPAGDVKIISPSYIQQID